MLCSRVTNATIPAVFPATPTRMCIMNFLDSRTGLVLFCYLSLYDELLTSGAIVGNN